MLSGLHVIVWSVMEIFGDAMSCNNDDDEMQCNLSRLLVYSWDQTFLLQWCPPCLRSVEWLEEADVGQIFQLPDLALHRVTALFVGRFACECLEGVRQNGWLCEQGDTGSGVDVSGGAYDFLKTTETCRL